MLLTDETAAENSFTQSSACLPRSVGFRSRSSDLINTLRVAITEKCINMVVRAFVLAVRLPLRWFVAFWASNHPWIIAGPGWPGRDEGAVLYPSEPISITNQRRRWAMRRLHLVGGPGVLKCDIRTSLAP